MLPHWSKVEWCCTALLLFREDPEPCVIIDPEPCYLGKTLCALKLIIFVAEEFNVVQKEVSGLLKGKILVGHALRNDLKVGVNF